MVEKHFPDQKEAFDEYLSEIPKTVAYHDTLVILNQIPVIGRQNILLQDRLDELKICPELQTILKQTLLLIGNEANEIPYYYHLLLFNYQYTEQYYPKNGAKDFALQSIPVIYQSGGKVLVGKKVKKIILNNKNTQVIGVQMDDREDTIIKANNVIGACNYYSLIEKCLPKSFSQNPEYLYLKEHTSLSPAPFFVFLGFKGTQEELQLPTLSIFSQLNSPLYGETLDDLLNANCSAYASFHSTQTFDSNSQVQNKSSGVLVCYHKNDLFDQWRHLPTTKRGNDYENLKKRIGEAMLEKHLYTNFPQLRGKVDYIEMGTSLSTEHYLEAYNGTAYGIKVNAAKSEPRIQKYLNFQANNVKGLYFCGQDIIGAGLFPVMISGIIVSSLILGYFTFLDIVTGRLFFKDFPNLLKYLQSEEEKKKKKQ